MFNIHYSHPCYSIPTSIVWELAQTPKRAKSKIHQILGKPVTDLASLLRGKNEHFQFFVY